MELNSILDQMSQILKSFFFYADVCPFHIFFLKAEWTLANLLREGDGDKAWRCDWEMKRQQPNNTFKVPDDESLKGSVIQVRVNHSDALFATFSRR